MNSREKIDMWREELMRAKKEFVFGSAMNAQKRQAALELIEEGDAHGTQAPGGKVTFHPEPGPWMQMPWESVQHGRRYLEDPAYRDAYSAKVRAYNLARWSK